MAVKMKKILFSAAAIAALASCSEAQLDGGITPDGGNMVEVSINVAIDDEQDSAAVDAAGSMVGSRMTIDNDWKISWEATDALLAWSSSDSAQSKFEMDSDEFDSNNVKFTGEVSENSSFRLIYPYSSTYPCISSGNRYIYTLYDQTPGATSTHMISSDLIDYSNIGEYATMKHIGATAELTLTFPAGYDGYTIESVVVNGLNSYASVYVEKSVDDSDFYFSKRLATAITITDGESKIANNTASMRFNIIPTTIASGGYISITTTISDSEGNKSSSATQVVNSGSESVEFERATYNTIYANYTSIYSNSWSDNAAEGFAVGDGSSTSPYEISSEAELAYLAANVNIGDTNYSGRSFKLTQDIDLSAYEWVAIGYSSAKCFSGDFDGDNHTISGLYIDETLTYQGLFGYINGASISNLTVEGSVTSTNYYVGGVVGYCNSSTIINCCNKATIVGGSNVGGVVGLVNITTVAKGSSSLLNCYNMGSILGGSYVGGVAGYISGAMLNSYEDDENGNEVLVGTDYSYSYMTNCYNGGEVISPNSYVGGVVGSIGYASIISSSYWDMNKIANSYGSIDTSGSNVSTTGYTTAEMKDGTLLNALNSGVISESGYNSWTEGTDGYPTFDVE